MQSAPRALISGLGLIGGSIGMALRANSWRVAFVDPNVDLDQARSAAAADEKVVSLDDAADVVVLATPVDVALKMLSTQHSGLRTLITSVCSVMQPLREIADARKLNFVAGHPLAGSHERGLVAARADLLRDRSWFVDRRDPLVERIVKDCGARLELVTAKEHDAAVALTSHLPQVLSTALAAYLGGGQRAAGGGRELRDFAGSGLESFLRLALSDASVWMPVFEANRDNLLPHVEGVMQVARKILDGDANAFGDAQAFMKRLKQ
ncbi:MAG TPA: prephenate dehydrogenase/arogenate dehydrogenase family protein [Thermoanaerobaculia bacterium]|nr:prephenate dehydrogenase/arogenate dehydrogenase family protein [Thermoanaerobaculia bacterium]